MQENRIEGDWRNSIRTCMAAYSVYRNDQHQDLKQQAVSDPDDQNDLKATANTSTSGVVRAAGDHETEQTTQYVAERIDDCVAGVAEGGGLRAIAIDN